MIFIKCKCLLTLASCIVENCFIIFVFIVFLGVCKTHASCALTMIVELLKKSSSSIWIQTIIFKKKHLICFAFDHFILVRDNDMAFCNFGGGFMVLKDVITKCNGNLS